MFFFCFFLKGGLFRDENGVYRCLCLYHLFGFWNSSLFTLNVHFSHFCSGQKRPGYVITSRLGVCLSSPSHNVTVNLQSHSVRNPPPLLFAAAVVSQSPQQCSNLLILIRGASFSLSLALPTWRSQFSVSTLAAAAQLGNFSFLSYGHVNQCLFRQQFKQDQ